MDIKKQRHRKSAFQEARTNHRHPLAAEIERSKEEEMQIVISALRIPTEEEFVKAMQSYGLSDEKVSLALEAWHEWHP
jgi:hypothetical protein